MTGRLQTSGEELRGLEYIDVRLDDSVVATVEVSNMSNNPDDLKLEILVFDPEDPTDSLDEFEFELGGEN